MKPFKSGIAHIAQTYPLLPVIPLYIYGAGKVLPKGEALFVPFIMDVVVGDEIYHEGRSKEEYIGYVQEKVACMERSIKSH